MMGYFNYTTLSLSKRPKKEMASLGENGQNINVQFSKGSLLNFLDSILFYMFSGAKGLEKSLHPIYG
jgi:hypothetical protein